MKVDAEALRAACLFAKKPSGLSGMLEVVAVWYGEEGWKVCATDSVSAFGAEKGSPPQACKPILLPASTLAAFLKAGDWFVDLEWLSADEGKLKVTAESREGERDIYLKPIEANYPDVWYWLDRADESQPLQASFDSKRMGTFLKAAKLLGGRRKFHEMTLRSCASGEGSASMQPISVEFGAVPEGVRVKALLMPTHS